MNNRELKPLVSSILIATLLASCTTAVPAETEPSVTSSSVIESSVSETTTETTETSQTGFTVETEQHENPLYDYSIENPSEYGYKALLVLHQDETYRGIQYGFDNPYSLETLQQLVFETTGISDTTVSLFDVNYFQYVDTVKENMEPKSFYEAYTGESYTFIYLEGIRAVMATEGLRFGIDEIPTSYLASRFPRFFYDGCFYDADDKCFDSYSGPMYYLDELESICDPEDEMYIDWLLYTSCLRYNGIRAYYMYKNPSGESVILQVQEASTGKHVLVPTETQAEQLQEDITSIPGCENIDIFTPESPEDFYEYYGYYPDELVNSVWSGNTQEGFEEYYNSLPEDEQNELYAPILFE